MIRWDARRDGVVVASVVLGPQQVAVHHQVRGHLCVVASAHVTLSVTVLQRVFDIVTRSSPSGCADRLADWPGLIATRSPTARAHVCLGQRHCVYAVASRPGRRQKINVRALRNVTNRAYPEEQRVDALLMDSPNMIGDQRTTRHGAGLVGSGRYWSYLLNEQLRSSLPALTRPPREPCWEPRWGMEDTRAWLDTG
jgi:hypothetical protein